jgi:hypothetical protein
MGSAGSGSFGNYRVGNNDNSLGISIDGSTGTINDATGKGTGEIKCPKEITNIQLEDVATSEYYMQHRSLPAVGETVRLRNKIHNGRLVIEKIDTQEVLGNLSTQYNYLIKKKKKNVHYSGVVIAVGITPIPFIVVTLNA